jgi:type I restriction enzyme S subunit
MTQKVKLSDLFKIGSSKRVLKAQWQTSGVPFYRGREITKLSQNGFVDNDLFISEKLYAEYATKHGVPTAGDIVITAIGTIGNSYIVRKEDRFYFKDASVLWLKRTSDVESKYVNLWLKSSLMREQLDEGNGATVDTLTIKKLQGLTLELPPIPEQKRIVALLDIVFSDLEQTRAKTEQNLKNARELFDSYLQQVFSQKGDDWVETTLGEITGGIATGPFGSLLHKSDYIENGIPLVNPAHIVGQKIVPDQRKTISDETALRLSNYKMKAGDIVIGRRGEMGRCALITQTEDGYLCGTGSFIIKSSDRCDGGFLVRFLRSASCVASLEKIAGGAVMPNLSNSSLSKFGIRVPSKNKQIEITKLIDKLSIEIEKIIDIYNEKLKSIVELKKSILNKAFSGELTTTGK